ncbi:mas-related G-protein coupled receptor member H-like [Pelodiscus sinensis]|uniref:mas-related G-protein coupled receptor member H-like n=1 Tax=Pelodiscus sinensis TaxID=13735 RepID=UPI003F6D4522
MITELRTTSLHPTESSLKNGTIYNWNDFKRYYPSRDQHVIISMVYVTLPICLLGLLGNGIVLWFLGFRIKRNLFTVYVLNLAAADFGFLLCLALSRAVFDFDLFYLSMSLDLLMAFTYSTSLYCLTAISVERCISVLFPIWYRCHRPQHLSPIICALLWALSCLLTGVRSFVCFSSSNERCQEMLLQLTSMNFLIFTPITVLSSLILIIQVQRSSLRRQPGKLYIVILLNVLFFLLLIVPFSIVTFFEHFIHYMYFITSSLMLASLNSSVNPVIYFLVGSYRNQQFRGSVKKALQGVFEEVADTREGTVSAA